jgi:general secretion pathway protein B
MSFILDALRKSESERQRNQTPGLATVQSQNTRKGTRFWIPLVALLIGINLTLVLVMWALGNSDSQTDTSVSLERSPVITAPAAIPPNPPATRPAQETTRLASQLKPVSQPSEPVTTYRPAEVIPAPKLANAPANETYTETTGSNLPTLEELMLQNLISLPPLRIDIHVYSQKSAERFVFINMSRYNEGETLSEGPRLMSISESGVVLRHQGQDFIVSRD